MFWELVIGLILMLVGGEWLVRGGVALAERAGVSPLMIGVTLIGFGTSAPELATCIDAALAGAPGLAVGNVIGSNIANVLLILAAGALLYPIAAEPKALRRDGPVLLASALICLGLVYSGQVGRWVGGILVILLIVYLLLTALDDRRRTARVSEALSGSGERKPAALALIGHLALTLLGLACVLIGAHLLVAGAVAFAGSLGVSEAVIGLTLVAVGTSLPELTTTAIASAKRQGAMAFGNVIGSNIFNSLGILGATALVQPIEMPAEVAGFDIWVMLAATLALLVFATTHWRISRREGAVLLLGYAAYIGWHAGGI
ncbi:MAG: calcium/sodium antiporter [Alphaproteobacteria bacterium]